MNFLTRHLQNLGLAALGLLSAELAEVSSDLGKTRKLATRSIVEWAVVFALAFWCVGGLTFAAIAALSLVWPPWASALVVSAFYFVGTLIVASVARASAIAGVAGGYCSTSDRRTCRVLA